MSSQAVEKMKTSAQTLISTKGSFHGYLKKYNKRGKVQNRFCIIHNGVFYYYKDPESKKPSGYFRLSGYQAHVCNKDKHHHVHGTNHMFKVKHEHVEKSRPYFFKSVSGEEQGKWVDHINKHVLECFPDSLYSPHNEKSDYYDYIPIPEGMSPPPHMYTLANEYLPEKKTIESRFMGPKYSKKKVSQIISNPSNASSEQTPIVPDRTSLMNKHHQAQSYLSIDKDTSWSEDYKDNAGDLENISGGYISTDYRNCDGYVCISEGDVVTTKGGDHSDEDDQYTLLIGSDYDGEDDEDSSEEDVDYAVQDVDYAMDDYMEMHGFSEQVRSMTIVPSKCLQQQRTTNRTVSMSLPSTNLQQSVIPPLPPERRTRQKVEISDNIMPQSCMYENIPREECLDLLSPYEIGTYLIRTKKDDGKDVISVVARKNPIKVKHFIVFEGGDGKKYLQKDEKRLVFLSELIEYYYHYALPQTEIKLTGPL